jgi:hypothetical protein
MAGFPELVSWNILNPWDIRFSQDFLQGLKEVGKSLEHRGGHATGTRKEGA